ncbi:unnamed protein product [Closterium sp. Naga37s-1]|nr:unnamed protein product [Closterium sp. Naga37s-1]
MEQRLPIQLQRALLPFQREGVAFAVGRGGRCLIADEMGVGKTIQAIAAAAWYMVEGPLLIVCPACLRLQWAEQLERWLPFLRPSQIHIGKPPALPVLRLQWAEQLERWLPFLRPSQVHIGENPALAATRLQWAEQLERWLPFLRPSQIHIVFGQRDDLVEEDQGERAVGASTDGHLNEHTDKGKSTGEANLERQRDELAEVEQGERAVGASTDGHMNGHTDKAKTTAPAVVITSSGGDHVLHHGRAAETNADEEAREVGHGGGGRGTNLSLFPLTPLNLSQPLVSPSITAPAVVITSFTMAGRLRRTLMRRRGGWGMVVVDEAHTRVVVDVIRRTKRAVLLTGTPSLSRQILRAPSQPFLSSLHPLSRSRPFDLFNLVDSLWPGLLGMSKYEYAHNYCDRGRDSRDFSRGIRLRELHILLSHTVMVRSGAVIARRGILRLKGVLSHTTGSAWHVLMQARMQLLTGGGTAGTSQGGFDCDSREFPRGIRLHEPHILLSHTVMVRSSAATHCCGVKRCCLSFYDRQPAPSPLPSPLSPRRFPPTRADATTAAISADEGGCDHRGGFRRRGRTRPPRRFPLTRADATTAADSADEGGRDHRGGFRRRGQTRPPRRIPPTRADATTAADSADEGGRDHRRDFRRRGRTRPQRRIPPTRADATTAADSADEGGHDHRGDFRRRGWTRPPRRFPPTRADATTAADSADEGGRDHHGDFRRRGRTRPPRRIPPTRTDATTAADSADEGGRDHRGDVRRQGRTRPPRRIPPTRADATTMGARRDLNHPDKGGRHSRGRMAQPRADGAAAGNKAQPQANGAAAGDKAQSWADAAAAGDKAQPRADGAAAGDTAQPRVTRRSRTQRDRTTPLGGVVSPP